MSEHSPIPQVPQEQGRLVRMQNFYDQPVFTNAAPQLADLGVDPRRMNEIFSSFGAALRKRYVNAPDIDAQMAQLEELFTLQDEQKMQEFISGWVKYYRYDQAGEFGLPKKISKAKMAEVVPAIIQRVGLRPLLYLADELEAHRGTYYNDGRMNPTAREHATCKDYETWEQSIAARIQSKTKRALDAGEITDSMGFVTGTTQPAGKSAENIYWKERGQVKGDDPKTG